MIGLLALTAAAAPSLPQAILTIDPSHRIVEGVASNGETIWVSSLLDRKILVCETAPAPSCRTLLTLPAPLHPFAVAWDESRKRLWIAADCPPGVSAIKPCDRGALMAVDARGRVNTRIAPQNGPFHPGDVSAAPGGVFVSDSQNGAVYRLNANGQALETLVASGAGKSAQGSALTSDAQKLIVADYADGVGAVDLAGRTLKRLPRPNGGPPLHGIDGMTRCGERYFGIYNGQTPGRLLTFALTQDGLDFHDFIPGIALPDPTQIAFDGKRLLIVADSGWATIDQKDFVRTVGTPILAIPLDASCSPQ